ncbi:unnamed protein product [Phytophthora lilii]|uniref:Unnamed protein product n=1 Tax=Phytophthora lilii TaxID=2077276 RepID=A0A9W6WH37_9STRA|nr:unnamed protein product [Phytophthora lilii]
MLAFMKRAFIVSVDGAGVSHIREHDEYWNKTAVVRSHASVLLLSGKLHPQTPHKYAEYLFDALDSPRKELNAFEHASHCIITSTPMRESNDTTTQGKQNKICGIELLASFVSSNGDLDRLDRSCIDQVSEIDWTIREDFMAILLETDDAYDGASLATAS